MTIFEYRGDTDLCGEELIGREIVVRWETGLWYDAVVVQYYEDEDEHKVVYRIDDGIEITRLTNRRWALLPKKTEAVHKKPVLDGAIIKFRYEFDGKLYDAMIYDYNKTGTIIKIAYFTEHSTDVLQGDEWYFVSQSPCSLDPPQPGPSSVTRNTSAVLDEVSSQRRPPRSKKERGDQQRATSSRRVSKRRAKSRRS